VQQPAKAVNRTLQLGNHTLHSVDDPVSIIDSINMQNTQNTNKTNTINDSEALLQLLSERLLLWDQQDAAQAAGEWHQALALEQSIRSISPRIRQAMGLLVPATEGVSEL
jgi:hypothetical protein